jgi:hypothetical protein
MIIIFDLAHSQAANLNDNKDVLLFLWSYYLSDSLGSNESMFVLIFIASWSYCRLVSCRIHMILFVHKENVNRFWLWSRCTSINLRLDQYRIESFAFNHLILASVEYLTSEHRWHFRTTSTSTWTQQLLAYRQLFEMRSFCFSGIHFAWLAL